MAYGKYRSSGRGGTIRETVTVSPDPKRLAAIIGTTFAAKLADFRPAFRRIAPILAQGLADNMRGGQSSATVAFAGWDPLDKRYLERKIKEGGGRAPLIFSGRTIGHLNSRNSLLRLGKRSVAVGWKGAEWKHVPALQWGVFASSKHTQGKRPFAFFNRSMASLTQLIMADHIKSVLADIKAAIGNMPLTVSAG